MRKELFNEFETLETSLEAIFQTPQPSDVFLDDLEQRLVAKHRQAASRRPQTRTARRISRWALAPAAILVAMMLVVLAIGPQKVLAQVQALIGYVPGVGFVDVNNARLMSEPVSQAQAEITVTVKQVMSGPEVTYVVLKVEGLPPLQEIMEGIWPPPADEENQAWQDRYLALWDTDARLILPDGTVLENQGYSGSPWDGYFTFPALPADVLSTRFEVTRLPGIPEGRAPEGWAFDLELGYADIALATPEIGESDYTADRINIPLPEAEPVESASEEFMGLSLLVEEVVYAQTETAIRLRVAGIPEDWDYHYVDLFGTLTDNLGNEYRQIFGPVFGLQPDGSYFFTFDPVSPDATHLTLNVGQIGFGLALEGQSVRVDFGSAPQVDVPILVNADVDVLGIPVHISTVTIRTGEVAYTPDPVNLTSYEFAIDATPARNDILVTGVMFPGNVAELFGADFSSVGGGGGGGGGSGADIRNGFPVTVSIGVPETLPLATGVMDLPVSEASISVLGPFEVTWEIPAQ